MTARMEFESPKPDQFSYTWQGSQDSVRFMLDQVDDLIEAIQTRQLTGVDAATELQLLTRSASTDAFSAAALYDDEAGYEQNKAFWDYALAQAEKVRAAYDLITDIPEGKEQKRIFMGQRANCDDHVQFFRTVCTQGIEAAVDLDTGHNPHVGGR